MVKNLFLAILFFSLIYFFFSPHERTTLTVGNQSFTLEIARTISQKSRGLSGRPSLCSTCGMVFIFDRDGIYPFWMKDTLIPLDIIWLDSSHNIVTIHSASPPASDPPPTFTNTAPARYVVEFPAKTAQNLNLRVGGTLTLNL